MASSPMSSLSSVPSVDLDDTSRAGSADVDDESFAPPSKRRKIKPPPDNYDSSPALLPTAVDPEVFADTDVSSDTTGSVPGSPSLRDLGMSDEIALGQEQVRKCSWDGCSAGDMKDQDQLVQHVHDEHVNQAKKNKYSCEWVGCRAKGKTQMSAYALRAHMRSHTKEKPFHCALPECDRSFTRSDALTKHMRTVHESESDRTAAHYAKRPKTPEPREKAEGQGTPANSPQNSPEPHDGRANGTSKGPKSLKLFFNKDRSHPSTPRADDSRPQTPDALPSPLSPGTRDELFGPFSPRLGFTADECDMPRRELFRLLRRQIKWAEQENAELLKENDVLEAKRREEWTAKELTLENVLEGEYWRTKVKGVFGVISEDGRTALPIDKAPDWVANIAFAIEKDREIAERLPIKTKSADEEPWYRDEAQRKKFEGEEEVVEMVEEANTNEQGGQKRNIGVDADEPPRSDMDGEMDGDADVGDGEGDGDGDGKDDDQDDDADMDVDNDGDNDGDADADPDADADAADAVEGDADDTEIEEG